MKKLSLGLGFGEQIEGRRNRRINTRKKLKEQNDSSQLTPMPEDFVHTPVSRWRTTTMLVFVFIGATVLFARLTSLQVIHGQDYRARSEANRIVTKTIHAPRGIIYDRKLKPLVRNTPVFVKVATDSAEIISY